MEGRILVTGAAGFIGSNTVKKILDRNENVEIVGIDNMNSYYDVSLKRERIDSIRDDRFRFVLGDITDMDLMSHLFAENNFDYVVNLAAQAGVRYSITNPDEYINSNVVGFYNILECCRRYPVKHLVYASSSSVYGNDSSIPYSTDENVDRPVSLYAATKKSNELFAHCYSKLYKIPTTGLRFFTVYGPCGRPDMAYYKFAETWRNGGKVKIYNYGNCERDFTYIDDITDGICSVIPNMPKTEVPYKVHNIGNGHPEKLMDFVETLHGLLVSKGVIENAELSESVEMLPMQPGDVEVTYADMTDFKKEYGYEPCTPLSEGLSRFVEWYSNHLN